jgi:acetyl esterase
VNRRANLCAGLLLVSLILGGPALAAQDENSRQEATERLRRLLVRFPDADANKDGTLTEEEARAYQARRQAAGQRTGAPAVKPTHADVSYGPADRNVLDFYQARSDRPTPLVVYIHGGGFVGGNKNTFSPRMVRAALDSGISFAAIHYRFVDGTTTIFPAPQHDGARAVQFLRGKAKEWNIDPGRLACFGGSAGAGISMWIGFHDDLADPDSSDPVLRQSTRIQAVGTFGGQGTYDPIEIKALVGGRAREHPSLFKVYGVKSAAEALDPSPEVKRLYDECAAIKHLTKDDPPLFMVYNEPDGPLPAGARPGEGIHHPNFGHQLKREMDKLGIENVYKHESDARGADISLQMLEFFKKHLGVKTQQPSLARRAARLFRTPPCIPALKCQGICLGPALAARGGRSPPALVRLLQEREEAHPLLPLEHSAE